VTADGRLVLLSHGRLHIFGIDGVRQQVVDLESIGAPPRPSDFDLHRDGRAVLTDPDNPELVRCTLPAGPCERVPVGTFSVPGQEVLPFNAAKLFVDDEGGRYFISDNSGHRVIATTFDGKLLGGTKFRVLSSPNRLRLVAPDRLEVVDTDHRRIAVFEVSPKGIGPFVTSRSTRAGKLGRPGRFLPFDVEPLPEGATAVLVAEIGMKNADLVFFDRAQEPRLRVDLGPDSDPFDVFPWRGRLWVADATRYRLDAVDFDGRAAPGLEDAAFIEELARERQVPEEWKYYRKVAQVALVVIPLFGALLVWKLAEEPAGDPRRAPMPARRSEAGIEWLAPRPAFIGRLRWITRGMAWLFLLGYVAWITTVMVFFQGAVFSYSGVRVLLPTMALMLVSAVVVFSITLAAPRMLEGLRLGARDKDLRYEVPRPLIERFRIVEGAVGWDRVYFDGKHRLVVGDQLLVLRRPLYGEVFDEAAFQRAIVARIPRANVFSGLRFLKVAWPAIRRQVIIVVLAALFVLAMRLLVSLRHL